MASAWKRSVSSVLLVAPVSLGTGMHPPTHATPPARAQVLALERQAAAAPMIRAEAEAAREAAAAATAHVAALEKEVMEAAEARKIADAAKREEEKAAMRAAELERKADEAAAARAAARASKQGVAPPKFVQQKRQEEMDAAAIANPMTPLMDLMAGLRANETPENGGVLLLNNDADLARLGDEDMVRFINVFRDNTTAARVEMANVAMGTRGAKAWAAVLRENHSITALNLEQNHIGAEGIAAFADLLRDGCVAPYQISKHPVPRVSDPRRPSNATRVWVPSAEFRCVRLLPRSPPCLMVAVRSSVELTGAA